MKLQYTRCVECSTILLFCKTFLFQHFVVQTLVYSLFLFYYIILSVAQPSVCSSTGEDGQWYARRAPGGGEGPGCNPVQSEGPV